MNIKCIPTGMIEENCYIIDDGAGNASVVDPGDEAEKILGYMEQNGLTCRWILLTHTHFDHVGALKAVQKATGAKVAVHAADRGGIKIEPDLLVKEGDAIAVGGLTFTVLETPGHTPGCVCYLCGDALFSGDTLFCESIGRTDFPGGDFQVMRQTLVKLRDLPYDDLKVYPGHMEATTLAHERLYNPFIGR